MRGPARPLLLGLLLVLGAAGPGPGAAEPREAADRRTLLRLILEIVQELKKYHAGESKRPQPLGPQDAAPGRREAADYGLDPEEQRAGECAPAPSSCEPGKKRVFEKMYLEKANPFQLFQKKL